MTKEECEELENDISVARTIDLLRKRITKLERRKMKHKIRKMNLLQRWKCVRCSKEYKTKNGAKRHIAFENWCEKNKKERNQR